MAGGPGGEFPPSWYEPPPSGGSAFHMQPYPLYAARPDVNEPVGPRVFYGLVVGWVTFGGLPTPVVANQDPDGRTYPPDTEWYVPEAEMALAPSLPAAIQAAVRWATARMVEAAGGSPLELLRFAVACRRRAEALHSAGPGWSDAPGTAEAAAWRWACDHLTKKVAGAQGWPADAPAPADAPRLALPFDPDGYRRGRSFDDEHGVPDELGVVVLVERVPGPDGGMLAVVRATTDPWYAVLVGEDAPA